MSQSASAGLLFAALLGLISAATWRPGAAASAHAGSWSVASHVVAGLAGAAVLCAPPLLRDLDGAGLHRPGGSFTTWALVVAVVAVAEEVFLRGTLFAAVLRTASRQRLPSPSSWAIGVAAVAFGLLHVPLYGWSSLPLDLAVGVWLGILREVSGSATAPAIAHVFADFAGWWLR